MSDDIAISIFNGQYFHVWARKVKDWLATQELTALIEKADSELSKAESKRNSRVCLKIRGALADHIAQEFVELELAHELWEALESKFASSDLQAIEQLEVQIDDLQPVGDDYVALAEKVHEIVIDLRKRGAGFSKEKEARFLIKKLMNGPAVYQSFAGGFQARTDKSFETLVSELRMLPKPQHKASHTALATKQDRRRVPSAQGHQPPGRDPEPCRRCNGELHHIWACPKVQCFKCWELGHIARKCENTPRTDWIVDSGADVNMTPDLDRLTEVRPTQGTVLAADGSALEITAVGTATVGDLKLDEVRLVPDLKCSLLSIPVLVDQGLTVEMNSQECLVKDAEGSVLVKSTRRPDGLFVADDPGQHRAYHVTSLEMAEMHKLLGHANQQHIEAIIRRGNVGGLHLKGSKDFSCSDCIRGKAKRTPQDTVAMRPAREIGEIVSGDLIGPIKIESLGGARYISVLIDHFSSYCSVKFLPNKGSDGVSKHVQEFIRFLERQGNITVKIFRTDGGKEYGSTELDDWITSQGIIRERTAPYSPAGNGKVERKNGTLITAARTLMISCSAPLRLWPYAVSMALYLQNRVLISTLSGMTPYETLFKRVPDLSGLQVFGCKCWVKVEGHQTKFAERCIEGRFIGHVNGQDGYQVWTEKGIVTSRNVTFQKNSEAWSDESPSEYDLIDVDDGAVVALVQEDTDVRETEQEPRRSTRTTRYSGSFHHVNTVRTLHDPDSIDVDVALAGEEGHLWKAAIDAEKDALIKNETWELVAASDVPAGRTTVGSKFVLAEKTDEKGIRTKCKARLVGQGFTQRYGMDYGETCAPVCKWESILILLSVAGKYDWEIGQLDINTAFLNAPLKEELYMRPPKQCPEFEGKVFRLKKAIYGLKQAGREWYLLLKQTLIELGWKSCINDECLFVREIGGVTEYLAVYVDDMLIVSPTMERVKVTKGEILGRFAGKDLGGAKLFLGVEIVRNRVDKTIFLSQEAYTQKILSRFGIAGHQKATTPINLNEFPPAVSSNPDPALQHEYMSKVGSLLHLARHSRPDLSFATGFLGRFSSGPTLEHMELLNRQLCFLNATKNDGLMLCGKGTELVGFSDADWAGDRLDRKSTSGLVVKLFGSLISWSSTKQKGTSNSAMEAELIALGECTLKMVWIQNMLRELGIFAGRAEVKCDNQAVISSLHSRVTPTKLKHVATKYHITCDHLEAGSLNLSYVNTAANQADMFTKALHKGTLHDGKGRIGIITPQDRRSMESYPEINDSNLGRLRPRLD